MVKRVYLTFVDGHCEAWGRWASRDPSVFPIPKYLGF